jgi:hypothetical protein
MNRKVNGSRLELNAAALAFPALIIMTGCCKEDRLLTVRCEAPSGENIAVEMGHLDATEEGIGLLDTKNFAPGTILKLTPGISQDTRGLVTAEYVLNTLNADFLPSRLEPWFHKLLNAHLVVDMDEDVRHALKPLNVDWQRKILDNTRVYTADAKRSSLKDPIRLINSDRLAVDAVRQGSDTSRFTLVSEVTYGIDGGLYYPTPPAFANNIIDISRFYLHINYTCPALEPTASVQSTTKTVSVFIQIPIKYDPSVDAVVIDASPIDLMSYDFWRPRPEGANTNSSEPVPSEQLGHHAYD